jgi:hypothetical protein
MAGNLILGSGRTSRIHLPGQRVAVPRRFPFRESGKLRGLGLTDREIRESLNERALESVYGTIRDTATTTLSKYGGAFEDLANLGRAINSGADFTEELNAVYDTVGSVASLIPVYGQVISVLLDIMQGLTNWLASAIPPLPDACGMTADAAAQQYCFAKYGEHLTGPEAQYKAYQQEGMFCATTVLYRRQSTLTSYNLAPSCFWPWNDYPVYPRPSSRPAPGGGCVMDAEGFMDCGPTEATRHLTDPEFTLRLNDGSNDEQKYVNLETCCRPLRRIVGRPPLAGGFSTWAEYLYERPDEEGCAAAIEVGRTTVERLRFEGRAFYRGWGFHHDVVGGDRVWISAVFFNVAGLDDFTLVHILDWFSRLSTTEHPSGLDLPSDVAIIHAPEDPTGPNGWTWAPGLAMYLEDWMYNLNPRNLSKHYYALLQEYKRRKDAGIWTIRSTTPIIERGIVRTESFKAPTPKKKETGLTTGETVVAVGGVAAAVALVTKLLKVW